MAIVTNNTTNRQKRLSHLFSILGKGVRADSSDPRPVLEQFIFAVCREGTTRDQAEQAYQNLQDRFFDWNEIRVTSVHELAEALSGLPEAETRAQRIIDFLHEVFETTFSFDLESMQKKGVKQAAKQLARYAAANDYATAWVVQKSLGGHAIPLDNPSMRALRRLGLLDEDGPDMEAVRAGIEHQVPKARGPLFVDLISSLAVKHCHEDEPSCPNCPLLAHCPTGQDLQAAPVAHASHRPKPR
jgi:endonuclease III